MKFKAVIFDWDGTIVDTMHLKLSNAAKLFAEHYDTDPQKIIQSYKRYSGISRRELFDIIAKENIGRSLSNIEFNRLNLAFTEKNISVFRNADVFDDRNKVFLQWLKDRDILLFVSSSGFKQEIETLAEMLGIKEYFLEILGSRPGFKKGRDHISYIREKYKLQSSQIIFVGDDKEDVKLVGKLGVQTAAVCKDKPRKFFANEFPDFVIKKLEELKKVVCVV